MRFTKCDICGQTYDDVLLTSKTTGYVSMCRETLEDGIERECYDLCPECTEKLKTIVHDMIGDKQAK